MAKKFYITTSIAYANALPHIGFALESIQADVVARYRRALGEDVFFLTGADEHGSKIEKTAQKAGKDPKDFVDDISAKFRELKKILNLSNDDFIRTTDSKRHWPAVKKIWLKLKEKGDIYKKKYKGFYCYGCESFIAERDLADGKCPVHQKAPELVEEENYFFRLSRYSAKIEKLIKKDELRIIPETRKNEVLGIIRQGLEDVSFSRAREKLKWGIAAPDDSSQTIYVWADALSNYISAIGYDKGAKFKKYWPADVHCIGKDILKFHALIWPGMLLSLGLKLPKTIFVHGFISVNGQKMSKSLGNVIDPLELVKKYGVDSVRHFLLREISPTEDGDFTYERFEERYNSDLANGLGNLAERILTMAEKSFSGGIKYDPAPEFKKLFKETEKKIAEAIKDFRFNDALGIIWQLISYCDKYINEKRPWENKDKKVLKNLLAALLQIALLLRPFLPQTSGKIFERLGIKPQKKPWQLKIKKGKPLFPRL